MQMRWQRMDVEIADKCMRVTFSLTGEDGLEFIYGVDSLKYLGRIMH